MLHCPSGAKTWVGQSQNLFFFYWAVLNVIIHFFLKNGNKKKKSFKKPTVDFKLFGSVAKGNTTSCLLRPNNAYRSINLWHESQQGEVIDEFSRQGSVARELQTRELIIRRFLGVFEKDTQFGQEVYQMENLRFIQLKRLCTWVGKRW